MDNTEWFYATKPTRWTLFLRTFLPWQMWRFAGINWRMLRMIRRSHASSKRQAEALPGNQAASERSGSA